VTRSFILCADDFGMTRGINAGILDLAGKGRISAVSCMVSARHWEADAAALRDFAGRIDLGLHFTITDRQPALTGSSTLAPGGTFRGLGGLALAILTGRLRRDDVRRELERQIERFADTMGRLPDHVDGHQHAHLLAAVNTVVVETIAARRGWSPWLRSCGDRFGSILGRPLPVAAATTGLLGLGLERKAHARGIAMNRGASGFYDVARAEGLAGIFPKFLNALGRRHLVVSHPGFSDAETDERDKWMRCRKYEHAWLSSSSFARLLDSLGLRLSTFRDIS
jgi:predicted glycoside hydrolase/deacetylase ChbG (UPF0249 family)